MFLRYASALAVCPGGLGTLDELFEALTLIQTRTIHQFPVVLLGNGEWDGLLGWLRERPLADGRIDAGDLELVRVVERPAEALAVIDASAERERAFARAQPRRTDDPAA
jgi:predicted Rossmann-fold nucleotide-binding protein